MRLISFALVALGLSLGACGKKGPAGADAGTAVVSTAAPTAAAPDAGAPPETKPPETTPPEADAGGAVDNTADATKPPDNPVNADKGAAVQAIFEAASLGKIEEALAIFADDVKFVPVGVPGDIVLNGRQALVDALRKSLTQFPDMKYKAARVLVSGNTVVAEVVSQGTHNGEGDEAAKGKKRSVAAGFVLRFGDDGKIHEALHFLDTALELTQLGKLPGQDPAAPIAYAAWPETSEVVKGEAVQANLDAVAAFTAKMKLDQVEAAAKAAFADDFVMYDPNSDEKQTGVEAAVGYLKAMLTESPDFETKAEEAISVGDWVVTREVNTLSVKVPGKPDAAPVKVTVHALGFAQFAGGKMKSYHSYANQLEAFAQLGLLGGAAEKPPEAPTGAAIGVAECDAYVKAMTACVDKMPEAGRGAAQTAMKEVVDAWVKAAATGDAAKGALATGCKEALNASKQGMAQLCPDVKWE